MAIMYDGDKWISAISRYMKCMYLKQVIFQILKRIVTIQKENWVPRRREDYVIFWDNTAKNVYFWNNYIKYIFVLHNDTTT